LLGAELWLAVAMLNGGKRRKHEKWSSHFLRIKVFASFDGVTSVNGRTLNLRINLKALAIHQKLRHHQQGPNCRYLQYNRIEDSVSPRGFFAAHHEKYQKSYEN
jgi:hypothetical protein